MIPIKDQRKARRTKIRFRIRKKIAGTATRPRLCLYKSNKAIYAQIIDDTSGKTLAMASSTEFKGKSIAHAIQTAQALAKRALEKNINQVVFDRSGYLYHGVVKAFSQEASKQGLKH